MALSPSLNRSTRGASKQRRDLINNEIERLKDLLPLSETIRQRLFQLQVMSLVCIYIRKERYLPHSISNSFFGHTYHSSCYNFGDSDDDYDICKALRGFLLMVTRQGKLLYLSENAADYLAHSVEEIMSQGDSLYDLVDQRDHGTVQAELLSGPPSIAMNMPFPDERVFMCRMNLSRAARRHLQYHKFILMHGRYLHPAEYYQALMTFIGPGGLIHPVFASFCTPLITPENAELLATGNTMVFCSLHNMDMKFIQVDDVAVFHLGYSSDELANTSWYRLIHPSDLTEASTKHKLLCEDKETCCILLVRLQTLAGQYLWLHTVLALKEGVRNESVEQLILATYQMLSDIEAATLQANGWIYSTPQRLQDQAFLAFGLRPADFPFSEPILIPTVDEPSGAICMAGAATAPATVPDSGAPASVKTKRKYSKSKLKSSSTSSTARLSQCSDDLLVPPPTAVGHADYGTPTPLGLGGLNIMALRGLSPPNSESTEDEPRAIMVEIPANAHHVIGLSSMLTPETSPANVGLLMNMTTTTNGGGGHQPPHHLHHHHHHHHHHLLTSQQSLNIGKHGQPMDGGVTHLDVNRILESPLPVIEPGALEAYLHHVESEGCIPVFGLRSDLTNKNPDSRPWAHHSLKPTSEVVGHGALINGGEVCRTFSSDDGTNQTMIPQTIAAWHRSASWCPTTSVEESKLQNMRSQHAHLNRVHSQCNNNDTNATNNNNINNRGMLAIVDQKPIGRV